jgi:peptide/nickel transport system ATP-binding protein
LAEDMMSLLRVTDLHVNYASLTGARLPALVGAAFDVQSGETLGVLGESGSGKSTLAGVLLRLLPANAQIANGAVLFEGRDLLRVEHRELREIRGRRIALIVQEPSLALHPTIRVGDQIMDVLDAHFGLSRQAVREKANRLLSVVFPAEAERIAACYPHELSGGQRQRVLIAEAIACEPSLIVADEPTASLDSTTQLEILALFKSLRQRLNLSMLFITHNPALLAGFADRTLVLYGGRVVEVGPTARILSSPQHPYTRALLQCLPAFSDASAADRRQRLRTIPGESPNLAVFAPGCRFESRCADRFGLCTKNEPGLVAVAESHNVSCFKYGSS